MRNKFENRTEGDFTPDATNSVCVAAYRAELHVDGRKTNLKFSFCLNKLI